MWSLRQVWAGWESDSPNPVHVVHYPNHPIEIHDAWWSTSSQDFHSVCLLTNMQSADVAIFVSHCDYMLTNHLHDYQHLCRCIDGIWMCWTVSFSFQSETLHSCLAEMSLSVGILCFAFQPNHSKTQHRIQDQLSSLLLSSSPAVTSRPSDQLWHPLPLWVWANYL